MNSTAIQPIETGVALPGCRLYPQGLQLTRELTDAECEQAIATLRTARAATEFWFGDFLAYDLKRKGVAEKHRDRWLGEFAHVSGLEAHEVKKWVRVSEYYPWQQRLPLSFSHHVDAMDGAGDDRQLAWSWMQEAEAAGLTASQFRAKIRKAQRAARVTDSDDPGPPEDSGAEREVAAIERWALQRMRWAAEATPAQARQVFQDFRHTADFLDRLRERLAERAPGKESITITV